MFNEFDVDDAAVQAQVASYHFKAFGAAARDLAAGPPDHDRYAPIGPGAAGIAQVCFRALPKLNLKARELQDKDFEEPKLSVKANGKAVIELERWQADG